MNWTNIITFLIGFCFVNISTSIAQESQSNCDTSLHQGDIYKIVEDMPTPIKCEVQLDYSESAACTKIQLDSYVMDHEIYDRLSQQDVSMESVHLRFIVEADGCLSNFIIRREACDGCGASIKNILQSMPKWNPGKTKNKTVRVLQNYTFRFDRISHSEH